MRSFTPQLFYLRQVGGASDLLLQVLAAGMYSSHVTPHPVPGLLVHREAAPVHVAGQPSVPQLLLAVILRLLVPLLLHRADRRAQHPSVGRKATRKTIAALRADLHSVSAVALP